MAGIRRHATSKMSFEATSFQSPILITLRYTRGLRGARRRSHSDLLTLAASNPSGANPVILVRTHLRPGIAISSPTVTLID